MVPARLLEMDQVNMQFIQIFDRKSKRYQYVKKSNNALEDSNNSYNQ